MNPYNLTLISNAHHVQSQKSQNFQRVGLPCILGVLGAKNVCRYGMTLEEAVNGVRVGCWHYID